MAAEVIEGEAREVALVPVEQHVERLDETATPENMVGLAARMASALADVVEKKKLYATIQGKKYPQVEAWQTIGRMDNVAAREIPGGIHRLEDGGWEAEVELIRLTDGMRVGYGSALCGTAGDNPWAGRPIHVQRSMAVTRATSRAFRQRYSWIMALAGYEPTPADEMPQEPERSTVPQHAGPRAELERRAEGMRGTVMVGAPPVDLQYRTEVEPGPVFGFKLKIGTKGKQCIAIGPLAGALAAAGLHVDELVEVWGKVDKVPWEKDGKPMPPYDRIVLERVATADWTLPSDPNEGAAPTDAKDDLSDLRWDYEEAARR